MSCSQEFRNNSGCYGGFYAAQFSVSHAPRLHCTSQARISLNKHDLRRAKKTRNMPLHTHTHIHTAVPAVTNGEQILYDDDDVKDQACWSPWMTSFVE